MTENATSDVDGLRLQMVRSISRLYRRLRSDHVDQELGDVAMMVLTRLFKDGPRSLRALSDDEGVTPASMSQTVNRLASAGYAIRERDPDDGRRVLIRTTPAGDELVERDRSRRHAWMRSYLARLGAADRAALERASEILADMAENG